MTIRLVFMLSIAAACNGVKTNAVEPDAQSPCWIDTYTPSGTIQLGTGDPFIPMPDQVALHYGTQAAFEIPVNARVTGMMPGNPSDLLDPNNPITRFHGFFVDTGEAINAGRCGVRIPYVPSVGSAYDLSHSLAIVFEVGFPESSLVGRQVRIVVEVIDSTGSYAIDEKVVTCTPPPGGLAP